MTKVNPNNRSVAHRLLTKLSILCAGTVVVFASACSIARASDSAIPIILAENATPAETTAANELAEYFGKMTGKEFAVLPEVKSGNPSIAVYVGPTAFAKSNNVDCAALGAEEWVLKSVAQNLIVAGGRPRGTLYAAYHLLEDHYGVRWWTPWEETVPRHADFKLPSVDMRKKPVFNIRDIGYVEGPGGRAGSVPFCAHNRLNRSGRGAYQEGDGFTDHPQYGGQENYGPPYHVHTLDLYVPSAEYYDKHPEWFALVDGKRAHGAYNAYNLCLTNPELRRFMLERLRGYIEQSRKKLIQSGTTQPVYHVSYNEAASCECPDCKALEEREGGGAGPLLELVNYLADNIRQQYPDVFIETLAYAQSKQPPNTLKPHDNVIIRLCDSGEDSDMLKPVTAPERKAFRDELLAWGKVASRLRIWDYGITYGALVGLDEMPLPTAHTYCPDFRFYAAHNVDGIFIEFEPSFQGNMRDFKLWVMMKALEDPYRDYETLLMDFTDGYYGPAGKSVRAYLRALEDEARARQSATTCWQAGPGRLSYLNLAFIVKAQKLFDDAAQAVRTDAELSRRVGHARLSLDRATIALHAKLLGDWVAEHGGPEGFPFDREAIGARALAAWCAVIDQRAPEDRRDLEKRNAERSIQRFAAVPYTWNLEKKNAALPAVRAPRIPDAGGDPGKADWSKAAALGGLWYDVFMLGVGATAEQMGSDKPATRKFSGRIAHDGRFLYMELTDPCETAKLVGGAGVFPYDDWEIFVSRQRTLPYRQYAFGPKGDTVALSHYEVNFQMLVPVEDKGGMRVFSDTSATDKWVSHVAFPLDRIIPGGVKPGDKIYMNITRVSGPTVDGRSPLGIDSWVSFCSIHDVDRLGEITLAP